MGGNAIFGAISLILTAGACVMTFFVILGGISNVTPLNQIYFLWADTSKISSAPDRSQWTLWGVCEGVNGKDGFCTAHHAAYPFLPQSNFGTSTGIPSDFLNHHRTYYYLSRFMFAFFLISIFFMVCSLVTGLLALCSRLGSAISSLTASFAAFCLAVTASLMTAVFILGRNAFRSNGMDSQVGIKAFAFTWASFACMVLSMILYCLGFAAARKERRSSRMMSEKRTSTRGGLPFFRGRRQSPAGESEQRFA